MTTRRCRRRPRRASEPESCRRSAHTDMRNRPLGVRPASTRQCPPRPAARCASRTVMARPRPPRPASCTRIPGGAPRPRTEVCPAPLPARARSRCVAPPAPPTPGPTRARRSRDVVHTVWRVRARDGGIYMHLWPMWCISSPQSTTWNCSWGASAHASCPPVRGCISDIGCRWVWTDVEASGRSGQNDRKSGGTCSGEPPRQLKEADKAPQADWIRRSRGQLLSHVLRRAGQQPYPRHFGHPISS
jgi:hypothetical protein